MHTYAHAYIRTYIHAYTHVGILCARRAALCRPAVVYNYVVAVTVRKTPKAKIGPNPLPHEIVQDLKCLDQPWAAGARRDLHIRTLCLRLRPMIACERRKPLKEVYNDEAQATTFRCAGKPCCLWLCLTQRGSLGRRILVFITNSDVTDPLSRSGVVKQVKQKPCKKNKKQLISTCSQFATGGNGSAVIFCRRCSQDSYPLKYASARVKSCTLLRWASLHKPSDPSLPVCQHNCTVRSTRTRCASGSKLARGSTSPHCSCRHEGSKLASSRRLAETFAMV